MRSIHHRDRVDTAITCFHGWSAFYWLRCEGVYFLHVIATDGCFYGTGSFKACPTPNPKDLEDLFRYEVFKMLKAEGKITDSVIENMLNWHHSDFNVYCGNAIWPHNDEIGDVYDFMFYYLIIVKTRGRSILINLFSVQLIFSWSLTRNILSVRKRNHKILEFNGRNLY